MVEKEDVKKILTCVLLFLFGLGLGNLEKIFSLFFLLIVLWEHIKYRNFLIKRQSQLIPLFLWGLLFSMMFIVDGGEVAGNIVYYLVAPSVMCIYGYDLLNVDTAESDFFMYAYVLPFGFFLHAVISVIISSKSGVFQFNAEHIRDIWTGRMISRTIMGMYMVPIVCFSVPMLFHVDEKCQILQKLLAIFIIGIAIAISIYVGNRALLIISAILTFVSFILALKYTKKKIQLLVFLALFLIIASFLLGSNMLNFEDFVGTSFLAKRNLSITSDGRLDAYKSVVQHFDDYLFGWISSGGHLEGTTLKWAHNVWLDILVYAGIIPLILFLKYSLCVIRDTIAVSKNIFLKTTTKITAVALVIGIFLNWAIEPVLQSNPYFLSACCMIFGMYVKLKMYIGEKNDFKKNSVLFD